MSRAFSHYTVNEHGHHSILLITSNLIMIQFVNPENPVERTSLYYNFDQDQCVRVIPSWNTSHRLIKTGIKNHLTAKEFSVLMLTNNGFTVLAEPYTAELYKTWDQELLNGK